MPVSWQAIEFIEDQTVEEFLKQFDKFDKSINIPWSAMGGIFEYAVSNPSPHDGRCHSHLPLRNNTGS